MIFCLPQQRFKNNKSRTNPKLITQVTGKYSLHRYHCAFWTADFPASFQFRAVRFICTFIKRWLCACLIVSMKILVALFVCFEGLTMLLLLEQLGKLISKINFLRNTMQAHCDVQRVTSYTSVCFWKTDFCQK